MRKWTYLVAALLMSGTAATFTSCIDNEEPAGIEAMRTAKADFYAAQAAVKQAQVAYQDALTAYQEQLVKEMELKNKALEIANQLAEATTAKDIAALEYAKAELLAQHEVKMQQIAANKAMADAALEKALVEMAKVVSAVNGEYTAEYARLLAKVTDNNAKYNMAAAQVTELRLQLAAATMNALDTASVRLNLQKDIDVYGTQLEYLKKQRELLTTISAPDANVEANMETLDKQIRELANDFNDKVVEMRTLFERKAKEEQDVDVLEAQYAKDNTEKYSKEVVAKIAIPENIEHDFIANIYDVNDATPSLEISEKDELVETTKVNGTDKYSLKDQNNEYVITVAEAPGTTSINSSTVQVMSNKLSALLDYRTGTNDIIGQRLAAYRFAVDGSASSEFDKEKLDQKLLELDSYKNAAETFKAAFVEDLKAYKAELEKYKTAISNYMYDSSPINSTTNDPYSYYDILEDLINELAADLNGSDEAKKAAAQEKLLPVLQKYGEYRMALDGWAYSTHQDVDPYFKVIKANEITEANAKQILGNSTLETGTDKASYKDAMPYDTYPYAAIEKAYDEAFGENSSTTYDFILNYPGNEIDLDNNIAALDAEIEDVLFTYNSTSTTWGGSFKEYLDKANKVILLEKAKSWNDLVETVKAAKEAPNQEYITYLLEAAVQADEVKKLELIVDKTQVEINKLGYEIVNANLSSDVIAVPDNINIEYKDGTNSNGGISIGTATDPNYAKLHTIKAVTAGGTLGNYIGKLITVHNTIASGITDFNEELQALNADIADLTKLYNDALNEMDEFENGGYTIVDAGITQDPAEPSEGEGEGEGGGGTPSTPTGEATVTITLSDGVKVTLTPTPSDGSEGSGTNPEDDKYGSIRVDITYPYTSSNGDTSSPSGNNGIFTGGSNETSFDIIYKLEWFEAAVAAVTATEEEDAPKAELTATFLKSWIEAKEAEITFWEEKMEDYKKEGEYIQKELDAFLAVINARYPAAQ